MTVNELRKALEAYDGSEDVLVELRSGRTAPLDSVWYDYKQESDERATLCVLVAMPHRR